MKWFVGSHSLAMAPGTKDGALRIRFLVFVCVGVFSMQGVLLPMEPTNGRENQATPKPVFCHSARFDACKYPRGRGKSTGQRHIMCYESGMLKLKLSKRVHPSRQPTRQIDLTSSARLPSTMLCQIQVARFACKAHWPRASAHDRK